MKKIEDILLWLNSKRNFAYPLIRIFLGTALFIRGIVMITDPSAIVSIAGAHDYYWLHSLVMVTHIIGGGLLIVGYQTRLAAIIQLPILVGAVFFVHLEQGLLATGQSLELSVLVMFLLLIYFLFGSGELALDKSPENSKIVGETTY